MSHNRDLSAAAAQIGFHSSNIGIGTDAPSETITLNHANGASIGLEYDGTENGTINVNSAAMYARAGSGKHLILGGNATESLRLTSGGDIGIANASPRAKLDIEDAGTSKDVILRVSADDTNPYALVVANDTFNTTSNRGFAFWVGGNKVHHIEARTSTTNSENEIMVSAGDAITFRTNVSEERLRITSAGNIGIGEASPDRQVHITNTTDTAQVKLETTASSGRSQVQYKTPNGDWVQGIQGATTSGDFLTYTADSKNILWFTGASERMRITSSGHVLRPTMAAATVTLSADQTTLSTFNTSYQSLVLNSEGYDNANNFNTSNYRFTAPETGFYNIGCNVQLEDGSRSASGNRWMYIYPLVNGATQAFTSTGNNEADFDPADTYYYSWNWSSIIKLSQNDYVEWKYKGNLDSILIRGQRQSVFYFYQVG